MKRTINPRPRLGRRKAEGLATLVAMFHQWLAVGFVPAGFTKADIRKAVAGLEYVRQLVAWFTKRDLRRLGDSSLAELAGREFDALGGLGEP